MSSTIIISIYYYFIMPSFDFAVNSLANLNTIIADALACVCRNTKILTQNGYILIQDLKIGDIVVTHDNRHTKIKDIKCFYFIPEKTALPRIIRKGNYGAIEDLYMSQYHAILIDDLFIQTRHLIEEINEEYNFTIEYFCVKTENYFEDTMIANGVTIETWGGYNPSTDVNDAEVTNEMYKEHIVKTEKYGMCRAIEKNC